MDLSDTIRQLKARIQAIDRAIAELQGLLEGSQVPRTSRSRRGRKSMGADERLEVAERMRRYWARRREQPPTEEPR